MRRLVGIVLMLLGWGGAAWSGVVGLAFSAVFLQGFIGTGGREAGGELAVGLLLTVIGVVLGLMVGRFGLILLRSAHGKAGR